MARALKTFCYSDGFHAWTVAATSRAKALEAWGVRRDLFKDGSAREVTDGADRETALKSPGELVERSLAVEVGTRAAKATRKPASTARARAREAVKALEAELDALEDRHNEEARALASRRAALEAEADILKRRHSKARDALKDRLKAARDKLGV